MLYPQLTPVQAKAFQFLNLANNCSREIQPSRFQSASRIRDLRLGKRSNFGLGIENGGSLLPFPHRCDSILNSGGRGLSPITCGLILSKGPCGAIGGIGNFTLDQSENRS